MIKHLYPFVAAAAACALLMAGCKKSSTPTTPKTEDGTTGAATGGGPQDPILVGHYASMTGSEATFGQSTDNGIRLALGERNGAGGVLGRQVKVITYDDQGKPQEAGTAVTRLITDDHVVAVLGEVASSLSLSGGAVAQQYGVPMISPSSTNPAVTRGRDMVSRVCFIDPFQGYVGARFARESLKAEKAAILYDQQQAYSTGLAGEFKQHFVAMGGTITSEQAYSGGDSDLSAQLTTIRASSPDVIYIPGYYTDVGNIAIQAQRLSIESPLLGGDGWDSSQLTAIGGDAIEGNYYSNHYAPDQPSDEVRQFVEKYQAAYGVVPDGLAALGYDAANLLFEAMERSVSLEGKDLAAAIAATKEFHGVTGVISMDENRDAQKPAVIVQIKGGKPTYVATINPQQ